jgi:phosphoribosyl 1,2-cyclic phosphodiesterase
MKYNIISTGSKGNAVVIENSILIDCGVPFKAIKPYMRDLQLVLTTHCHGDHANKATIRKLASERPMLRWGCGEWMVPLLVECGVEKRNIDVYEFDTAMAYSRPRQTSVGVFDSVWLSVEAFPLFHDVPNCGYKLMMAGNGKPEKLLYATDTNKILTEAKNYDLYLVEANYEDEEVQERIDKQIIEGKDYIHEYKAMRNHLSQKAAYDFIVANMGPNSTYFLLHGHEGLKEA